MKIHMVCIGKQNLPVERSIRRTLHFYKHHEVCSVKSTHKPTTCNIRGRVRVRIRATICILEESGGHVLTFLTRVSCHK